MAPGKQFSSFISLFFFSYNTFTTLQIRYLMMCCLNIETIFFKMMASRVESRGRNCFHSEGLQLSSYIAQDLIYIFSQLLVIN
jgi:exosortase/archaeosortase